MQKSILQKMSRVLELATELNPVPTEKEKTGNKPTIFVDFSGHISKFGVLIYSNGWDGYNRPDKSWDVYFRFESEQKINATLDDVIKELERLKEEEK